MSNIKILVDSGSDLSMEYCEKYDITVIPLNLQIEGRTVADDTHFDAAKYCEYLKVSPQVPKSAQPSPQAFLDSYRHFSSYEHIIVITMSAKASGTHQSAVLARDLFEEENQSCHVHVVDSASTSFAISMLAFHAAQMCQNGQPAAEIVAQLVEDTLHIGAYYLVDNISFLIKGGRISTIKGGLLSKMSIKPIIGVRNGMAYNHSNALGFQKGLSKLVSLFQNNAFPGSDVFISHSNCAHKAKQLEEAIHHIAPGISVFISQMRGTMCTHAGPDTVGLFFYQKQFI
ncbi:MAG: DegV family protein [Oscillospiraceae bacterium]|nr:DegV family protein [Oscillospiraceae bacterium]